MKNDPQLSAVGPLLSAIKANIELSQNDFPIIREVKILATDLDIRYNNPDVVCVFFILDPRFKTLAHLPDETGEQCAIEVKKLVLDNVF